MLVFRPEKESLFERTQLTRRRNICPVQIVTKSGCGVVAMMVGGILQKGRSTKQTPKVRRKSIAGGRQKKRNKVEPQRKLWIKPIASSVTNCVLGCCCFVAKKGRITCVGVGPFGWYLSSRNSLVLFDRPHQSSIGFIWYSFDGQLRAYVVLVGVLLVVSRIENVRGGQQMVAIGECQPHRRPMATLILYLPNWPLGCPACVCNRLSCWFSAGRCSCSLVTLEVHMETQRRSSFLSKL